MSQNELNGVISDIEEMSIDPELMDMAMDENDDEAEETIPVDNQEKESTSQ